ncbi:hypothetical protein BRADI_2g28465v3, partial [Brachypodium distachyon]
NGIVWRVGDGENINIWTDPWLPKGISRIVTSIRGNNLLTKVVELIDHVSYSWDEQLIKQTFYEEDAQTILQIPIQEGAEDFLAWHFDKKGNFSVKSAYQVVLDTEARESEKGIPSTSHNPEISTNLPWKKLWALPLPCIFLHFLWRLANNSLPLRTKLKRRGALMKFFSYQLHLTEYCEVMTRRKKLKRSTQQVWSPPPTDFLKINTDGAFIQSSCFVGWGFTVKNEHGEALVAGADNLKIVADPLHAETAAMLHTLQEAARMECHKVILETDASTLKQAMTSNDYDNSSLGVLLREMKALIQYSFQRCKIEVCPRACNVSAHCLAAFGMCMEQGSYHVWLDPFPDHVKDLVAGVCPARLS